MLALELKGTTNWGFGKAAHRHVVFLNKETGEAVISSNANHQHQIEFSPQDGGWFIHPDQTDGHTHQIIDIQKKFNSKKQDEETVVSEVIELFKTALDLEGDSLKKAEESEKFYCGDQWDNSLKNKLKSQKRAALTLNFIQRNIDELCGYQRENRTDIHYVPKEDGDQRAADLLNLVTKTILDNCDYGLEESLAFEDQSITGRGNFNVFVDFSKDLRGEIRVERFPWDSVLYGSHEKVDGSDCEYICKHKVYSLGKLKQLYPDKADKLTANTDLFVLSSEGHTTYATNQYALSNNFAPVALSGGGQTLNMVDIAKKEYRVLECWRKVYTTSTVIANPDLDFYFNADGWQNKDIEAAKYLPGFFVVPKTQTKIRVTRVCSGVLLSDENPADLAVSDFFTIPVYAHKKRNNFWGKVEIAKDPQQEINKRHSQSVDIGNTMVAYNYFIDENTFPDSSERNNFINNSSTPGSVFTVNTTDRLPVKTEGAKFPTEIVNMMTIDKEHLQELMNVSVPPTNAYSSGDFLIEAQKLRLRGNQYLFDNMAYAKKRIGLLIVHLIQKFYPPERIMRIIGSVAKPDDKMGDNAIGAYDIQEIAAILSNLDITKYDVTVTEQMYSPTMKIALFKHMSELAKAGLPIPPDLVIEFLDVPQNVKMKMIQSIQAQQQAEAQSQTEKSESEVVKSLIGHGVIPPAVQEKYGIQQPGSQQPMPPQSQQPPEGLGNTYGNVAQY